MSVIKTENFYAKIIFGKKGTEREKKFCDFVTAEVAYGVGFFFACHENYNSGRLPFILNTAILISFKYIVCKAVRVQKITGRMLSAKSFF